MQNNFREIITFEMQLMRKSTVVTNCMECTSSSEGKKFHLLYAKPKFISVFSCPNVEAEVFILRHPTLFQLTATSRVSPLLDALRVPQQVKQSHPFY
jgi:hypothetical protein